MLDKRQSENDSLRSLEHNRFVKRIGSRMHFLILMITDDKECGE